MSKLIVPTRRGFLAGLGALIAAPAIVHASNIMPVRMMPGLDPDGGYLVPEPFIRGLADLQREINWRRSRQLAWQLLAEPNRFTERPGRCLTVSWDGSLMGGTVARPSQSQSQQGGNDAGQP